MNVLIIICGILLLFVMLAVTYTVSYCFTAIRDRIRERRTVKSVTRRGK